MLGGWETRLFYGARVIFWGCLGSDGGESRLAVIGSWRGRSGAEISRGLCRSWEGLVPGGLGWIHQHPWMLGVSRSTLHHPVHFWGAWHRPTDIWGTPGCFSLPQSLIKPPRRNEDLGALIAEGGGRSGGPLMRICERDRDFGNAGGR